jgi:DNA-binding sugar fermentation-stimulating protein
MLLKIDGLIEGVVTKRPSKIIKTPYVADVINNENAQEVLAHTAALGCCGLADVNAKILMTKMPIPKSKNTTQKCSHRIYLSVLEEKGQEIIVGIHPKLAEELAESALQQNLLHILPNVQSYKRETVIFVQDKVDSRFDFTGIDQNGCPFIMEVKNVPLADYEDITAKERKKRSYEDYDINSKIAYFPDGYRKKTSEPVSPRALKHVRELTLIKKESKTRCILCFVIQRTDVQSFQPSTIDPEYREAVKNAMNAGVEIITLVVHWNKNGEATFVKDNLPINL